jgi:adenylosuccinate synthase
VSEKSLDLSIADVINADDEFLQGIAVRLKGGEYGKTTARPRRTGWLDLVALDHAIRVNDSPDLILTKLDVMTGVKQIKLCVGYNYEGPEVYYGDKVLIPGESVTEFVRDSEILYHCKPMYKTFPGWKEDISKMRTVEELPEELREILRFIERFTGASIVILSVGPSNEDTIFVNEEL